MSNFLDNPLVPKCHSQVITILILRNWKTHAHEENEEKKISKQRKFMPMKFKIRKLNFLCLWRGKYDTQFLWN